MNYSYLSLVAFLASTVLGCESLYEPQSFEIEEVGIYRADSLEEPPPQQEPIRLRAMTWNIKYAAARIPFWFDCWGDRVKMTPKEVTANMAQIYALISEADPDILMAQEVEINSRRSAYFNMVQGILNHTSLNYAAYFEGWNSRYIPSEGLGRMNLGTVIFSKYPIAKAQRIKQANRTDQDALTNAFYIKRAIGHAEISVTDSTNVAALVVHTEAYDEDGTKKKHIEQLYQIATTQNLPTLLGGDFNELPPTALQTESFFDDRRTPVCGDDYKAPPYSPELLQPFFDTMQSAISLEQFGTTQESQKRFFTHSILGPDEENENGETGFWSRTLDYLFVTDGSWVKGSTDVLQTTGQKIGGVQGEGPVLQSDPLRLSDHAPVIGVWELSQ